VQRYKINQFITAPQLFVIDSDGSQLGVLDKQAALSRAIEQDLDLIEVSPNAKPPVAKIYSWSKFKYQQEKKKKENKSRPVEQKEMWFKAFIGEGDFNHKIDRVKEFLAKKHPVKITIRARGRVHNELLWTLLEKIKTALQGAIAEQTENPKMEGRNLSMLVRPAKIIKVNEIKETKNESQNTQGNTKTL